MTADIDWAALAVFVFFFALVTVLGFAAAHWRRPKTLAHLDEWGLGGRQFGTWITWFLIGGDIYTAYTMIAVPALVYAVGAYGFFAVPYTILVYPFVFAVMPLLVESREGQQLCDRRRCRLWPLWVSPARTCRGIDRRHRDHALYRAAIGRHGGSLSTLSGIKGELPLVAAFLILGASIPIPPAYGRRRSSPSSRIR